MSNNSDGAEAIFGLIGICLIVVAVGVAIAAAVSVAGVFLGIGGITGVGHALYNYQKAFSANVKKEVV